MEELQPEELEQLVQELGGESGAEEAPSPEVEQLLQDLQPNRRYAFRRRAAKELGEVGRSNRQMVEALVEAMESDSSATVRAIAAESVRAPVHQEILQEHPDLMQRQAVTQREEQKEKQREQQTREMERGAPVQRRIYPKPRIQERHLLARIMGVPFVLFGLGALVLSAVGVTQGIDLTVLMAGVFGLVFTYVGLYVIGLDLRELLLALLHRGAWQGQLVTAEGRIIHRDIEEHKHEDDYGGVSYSYTYWITFGFPTTKGPVRLKTPVDEQRYDQLKRGQPVKVRYAQEEPRLALLEWESD